MRKSIGKIKSLKYEDETQYLELHIEITDDKFKKRLLRDLTLSGNLQIINDRLVFISSEESDDAKI